MQTSENPRMALAVICALLGLCLLFVPGWLLVLFFLLCGVVFWAGGYVKKHERALPLQQEGPLLAVKEPELITEGEEPLPEELLELFGVAKEGKDARGLIETAFGNFLERRRLKSESKTAQARREHRRELLEDEKLEVAVIESRIARLKAQFEAGLITPRQLELLSRYFPQIYEMVSAAKRIRELKQLKEEMRLQAEIAKLRHNLEQDGLELYRQRWRQKIEKVLADLRGRHGLRAALLKEIEKLAKEMGQEGRSETEIKLLKSQLMRDLEQILLTEGMMEK